MPDGRIPSFPVYKVVEAIQPIICTDGVPVRRNNRGKIEGMVIRRGTGHFAGKLCSIGGKVRHGEGVKDCLRRQFKIDLGVDIQLLVPWSKPITVGQWIPTQPGGEPPTGFLPEVPGGKHAISLYYPVEILSEDFLFGATAHGGQEATSTEWYTIDKLPSVSEFGYDQRELVAACIRWGESRPHGL